MTSELERDWPIGCLVRFQNKEPIMDELRGETGVVVGHTKWDEQPACKVRLFCGLTPPSFGCPDPLFTPVPDSLERIDVED